LRRPTDIEKITILLPCFNEGANLTRLESELLPVLNKLGRDWELILVDDGSQDNTPDVIRSLSQKIPSLKSVVHLENQGLGAALISGFSIATGDVILTLDADLTFHPNQIPAMLDALTPDTDAVFGSPRLGKMSDVSFFRKLLSNGVNFLYRILLGKTLTSASSIFRLYRRSQIKELTLKSQSFDINAEILIQLLKRGAVIKEIPAELTVRKYGVSKIKIQREIGNHLKMLGRILAWRIRQN
jgi:dolichol-phosphate mannosyltransferase